MKELVFAPIAAVILLGFMANLSEIATSTSEKALNYANEMDSAVDCAFRGVNVEECSDMDQDFEKDKKEAIDFNKELIDEYGVNVTNATNQLR
ncbi:MAG: hypothetical protein ACQEP1_00830 [Nanobdellota archaeon]